MLFHHSAWEVATKLKGVVMTSPVTRSTCRAMTRARVPFGAQGHVGHVQVPGQLGFQFLVKGPGVGEPFAVPDLLHEGGDFGQGGGRKGWVTLIGSLGLNMVSVLSFKERAGSVG
jgi:hypothetical protein